MKRVTGISFTSHYNEGSNEICDVTKNYDDGSVDVDKYSFVETLSITEGENTASIATCF